MNSVGDFGTWASPPADMHSVFFQLIIMKRLFIVALIVFSAAGCSKKEGVVPADQKLDRVVASEASYHDAEQVMNTGEYVEEQWTWDGKRVIRIDYRGENQYSENFFHDGRQIVRTTIPAYNIRSELSYDGRQLERIDIYRRDKLAVSMLFSHHDDRMTEIVCQYFEVDSDMQGPVWVPMPLGAIVGDEMSKMIGDDVARQLKRVDIQGKALREVRYGLTWDGDDNVVRIDVSGAVESYAITLTYDNKNNPYDQLYAGHELNEPIFGFKMLSEHNVTSIRRPYDNHGTILFNYSYTYDDDYPASRKLTYSYRAMNALFDTITVRKEKTERYFYK